jgi:hypothetical protein
MGGFELTKSSIRRIIEHMPAKAIDSGDFRKRPIVVKAYRYKGSSPKTLQTLEGPMIAKPGDWIITGVEGEKYACDDAIFRKTYEPVGKTKGVRQAFRRSS